MGSSVEMARARRRKAEQAKAAKEQAMWKKAKKPLFIALIAVALIAVVLVLFNMFYLPPNGVAVRNGVITGAKDNWIVANFGNTNKPDCRRVAEINGLDGYTLDPDYDLSGSKLFQARYYAANDTEAPIRALYVAGIPKGVPENMVNTIRTTGYFNTCSEPEVTEVAGKKVHWVLADVPVLDEDGNAREDIATGCMYSYIDGGNGFCMGLVVMSRNYAVGEAYAADVYMSELEKLLNSVSIVK